MAVTYSPFSVADGPRRVPRAVSEFPEIHVSVALSSGIMPMFVEGGGVEPPAHLSFFGESPPLWSDAVALISVGGPHPLIPIFCLLAPTIQAFTSQICLY